MSNLKWMVAFGVVLIVAVVIGLCLHYSNGELKAENERLAAIERKLQDELIIKDKEAADAIAQYEEKIALLNGEIDSANTVIANLEAQDEARRHRIDTLEAEYASLQECEPRLVNMTSQRDEWRSRFSLCDETVAQKDHVIFSLAAKYDLARKEIDIKDGLIVERDDLLGIKTERLAVLEKYLSKHDRWDKVKTGLAWGGLAAIVLLLVK